MIIVQIIPSLWKGGGERFVVDLASELALDKNNEIHVISLFDNNVDNSFISDLSKLVRYHALGKKVGFDISIFLRLRKLLKKIRPDVVHCHFGALEYILPIIMITRKIKYFYTIHNDASKDCPSKYIRTIRAFLFKSKKVFPITISTQCSLSFEDYYNQKTYNLIENGRNLPETSELLSEIQIDYRKTSDKEFLLVNVARISQQKNQQLLVNAINKINEEKHFILKLLIIGDVQDKDVFLDLKKQLKNDHIKILSSRNNIADYLAVADAFCLSSSYEGMPISLIEALGMGCVPICTEVGAMKEMIIEGKTGFLSKSLNLVDYINAIKRFILEDKKSEIKENCKKEFIEKYHISITSQKHKTLYLNK